MNVIVWNEAGNRRGPVDVQVGDEIEHKSDGSTGLWRGTVVRLTEKRLRVAFKSHDGRLALPFEACIKPSTARVYRGGVRLFPEEGDGVETLSGKGEA